MKRKLEISELIFKIISYTLLTVFALACLYPFVYAISAAISGRAPVEYGQIVLFPKELQFDAFKRMFNDNMFWNAYSNTLFITFYGTVWALLYSILGAYALSKRRLLFRKFFNFFLVASELFPLPNWRKIVFWITIFISHNITIKGINTNISTSKYTVLN